MESNHQLTLRRGRLYPFNYGETGKVEGNCVLACERHSSIGPRARIGAGLTVDPIQHKAYETIDTD